MAKEEIISKEDFFQNIYECALGNFSTMEACLGIHGIMGQVFGVNDFEELGSASDLPQFKIKQEAEIARNHFMNGKIWYPFECVYEYAVNGNGWKCCIDELTDCVDFLHILHSDHFQISSKSHEVITMALVRHSLDHDSTSMFFNAGDCNYPLAIAQLANVDLRTVKNAVSGGEIEALSKNELSASSLKQWLLNRKGFKPTFYTKHNDYFFNSQASFAEILKNARANMGEQFDPKDLTNVCPNHPNIIEQLELGVLELSLDKLSLVAKVYQIPYPILFKNVMQTYYPNEYALLTN
jgi:hypothetical protein